MNLLIDCNYLFHRSRHALRDVSLDSDYVRTEIVFGFLSTLLALSKRFVADEWTFAWDSKLSWRERMYPAYKAERKRIKRENLNEMTPDEKELQKIQFDQLKRLKWDVLPALGFKNSFSQAGAEGDDIIAKIVKCYPQKEFLIIATDKDLYQLITDKVSIYSAHTDKVIDLGSFSKQYGITPEQWGIAKAIGGCATDEVVGIKGCSDPGKSIKSRALGYLRNELPKGKILDLIESEESQKIIERNKELVILPHKNTLDITLEKHSLFAKDFISLFEELEFRHFLKSTNFREWTYIFNLV